MNIRVKFWNKIAETALHGIQRAGGYDVCDRCIVTLRSQLRWESRTAGRKTARYMRRAGRTI